MQAMEQSGVCVRCHQAPRVPVWSCAERKYLHLCVVRTNPDGSTEVCGGEIVEPGAATLDRVRPGEVLPCFSATASLVLHLVRLGRLANRRNQSWTGTALCGTTYRSGNHWLPRPEPPAGVAVCEACAKAHARAG